MSRSSSAYRFDEEDEEDDDEAPETPTDEPEPIPIQDPPSDDAPQPPLTVSSSYR